MSNNVTISKLIFFNHWRNGDCFIGKEYVREIINTIRVPAYYAHNNHESVTQDLPCELMRIDDMKLQLGHGNKIVYDPEEQACYINTWVGAFLGTYFNPGNHANFVILNKIWRDYYKALNIPMVDKDAYYQYLPKINFNAYDLTSAKEWIQKQDRKYIVVISNGRQQSDQSDVGDMEIAIDIVTDRFKNIAFLICDKVNDKNNVTMRKDNITYSSDIFNSTVGNLPHISYITHFANLIVGKNSGPFSFAHTHDNLTDPNKIFLCFSRNKQDCLTGEGKYVAPTLFSNSIFERGIADMISYKINSIGKNITLDRKYIQDVYNS